MANACASLCRAPPSSRALSSDEQKALVFTRATRTRPPGTELLAPGLRSALYSKVTKVLWSLLWRSPLTFDMGSGSPSGTCSCVQCEAEVTVHSPSRDTRLDAAPFPERTVVCPALMSVACSVFGDRASLLLHWRRRGGSPGEYRQDGHLHSTCPWNGGPHAPLAYRLRAFKSLCVCSCQCGVWTHLT